MVNNKKFLFRSQDINTFVHSARHLWGRKYSLPTLYLSVRSLCGNNTKMRSSRFHPGRIRLPARQLAFELRLKPKMDGSLVIRLSNNTKIAVARLSDSVTRCPQQFDEKVVLGTVKIWGIDGFQQDIWRQGIGAYEHKAILGLARFSKGLAEPRTEHPGAFEFYIDLFIHSYIVQVNSINIAACSILEKVNWIFQRLQFAIYLPA